MNFLYPEFLFGLFAISIPIIIHLFNFRRYKTVYFSNLQFLKNIKKETKSKSEIKHLLILITRILAITALVIAFAQPYVPTNEVKIIEKEELVGIFIDNSFSMDAEGRSGNLLEVAKNRAFEIVKAYPAATKFLLLTNDFDLKHQHLINKEQLLDYISEIKVSPNTKQVSQAVSRLKELIDNSTGRKSVSHLYLISDFQTFIADFQNLESDSLIHFNIIPLAARAVNNLFIDSCWFDSPGRKINQSENLLVRISNNSDESYQDIPIKLYLNDSLKSIGSFNVNPNSDEEVTLSFTNTQKGILHGKIEITDYPITYDNTFFFNYEIASSLEVLVIGEGDDDRYLNALFSDDQYINTTFFKSNSIKQSEFANYHTIILNSLSALSSGLINDLGIYVSNGGTLVFIPNLEGDILSYNTFFEKLKFRRIETVDTNKTMVEYINFDHEIYNNAFKKRSKNLDLPVIFKHFKFQEAGRSLSREILSTQNKQTILASDTYGKGKLFYFATSLSPNASNFAKHSLFIPTLYNIALYSQQSSKLYYKLGVDEVVEITNSHLENYNIFKISSKSTDYELIPQHLATTGGKIRLFLNQSIKFADNYLVLNNDKAVTGLAFNYNRAESDLSYIQVSEIVDNMKRLGIKNFSMINSESKFLSKNIQEMNRGKQFWKLFIILALLFLGIEIGLIRLWR